MLEARRLRSRCLQVQFLLEPLSFASTEQMPSSLSVFICSSSALIHFLISSSLEDTSRLGLGPILKLYFHLTALLKTLSPNRVVVYDAEG